MTPTLYTLSYNGNYTGMILMITTPDGPIYGRTMFNPADLPSPTNDFDRLPQPTLGMDGNIYALTAIWDGNDYFVELIRWVTTWNGEQPAAGSTVASATVGGEEPDFFNQTVGYLIPGGSNVQAFFSPALTNEKLTIALSPSGVVVLEDCAVPPVWAYGGSRPFDNYVVGLTSTGYTFCLGERLV